MERSGGEIQKRDKKNIQPSAKFIKAQRRLNGIKGFYRHLTIYILVNVFLLFLKVYAFNFMENNSIGEEGFRNWFKWHIVLTPIIWGIFLFFHGLYVFTLKSRPLKEFRPKLFKKWEERMIEKYMEENDQNIR
ncbi:MAG: 2TM domain-containing protein [Saonia sp.]